MQYDYDLLVIGAGSGGVRAARRAAEYGANVAICEQTALGGTCVNAGCIPKKLLVYAAEFADAFAQAGAYGWQSSKPFFDWPTLRTNMQKEIQRINLAYQDLLDNADIAILQGKARLQDKHHIELNGRTYSARYILIATGARALLPPIPGIEHAIDSDAMFQLPTLPKSLAIIGGGYIASEFAGLMQRLGVSVTVIAKSPRLLMGFDEDCAIFCTEQMQKNGINVYVNHTAQAIQSQAHDHYAVIIAGSQQIIAEQVLVATGREANIDGLGLEAMAIEKNPQGFIKVDKHFATSIDSIFAIGDVTGGQQLTPAALAEGEALASYLFDHVAEVIPPALIPTTVFANPPVAKIGLTEQQAREKGLDIVVFSKTFTGLKSQLTGQPRGYLLKLIVDKANDRVLGAHMAGNDAAEIMQGIAIALQAGATKADFDRTIGIHPTAAEEFVSMRRSDSAKS